LAEQHQALIDNLGRKNSAPRLLGGGEDILGELCQRRVQPGAPRQQFNNRLVHDHGTFISLIDPASQFRLPAEDFDQSRLLLPSKSRVSFANQFDALSTNQVKEPTSTTIPEMRQCFDIAVS
jgi:hypothetical protein